MEHQAAEKEPVLVLECKSPVGGEELAADIVTRCRYRAVIEILSLN